MGDPPPKLEVLVDLMKHQDSITWLAFQVSVTVQAAFATIYQQFEATRATGTALFAAFLAASFGFVVHRSNVYMSFYAEEATKLGLPDFGQSTYAKGWPSRYLPARRVMAAVHLLAFLGWLAVAAGLRIL